MKSISTIRTYISGLIQQRLTTYLAALLVTSLSTVMSQGLVLHTLTATNQLPGFTKFSRCTDVLETKSPNQNEITIPAGKASAKFEITIAIRCHYPGHNDDVYDKFPVYYTLEESKNNGTFIPIINGNYVESITNKAEGPNYFVGGLNRKGKSVRKFTLNKSAGSYRYRLKILSYAKVGACTTFEGELLCLFAPIQRFLESQVDLDAYTSSTTTLIKDTPPTVSITAPGVNQLFAPNTPISVKVAANDVIGGIAQVEAIINNIHFVDTTSPYIFPVNDPKRGQNTITVIATGSGGVTASASRNFDVNAAPAVTISAPVSDNTFKVGDNVTLRAIATDDTQIVNVKFYSVEANNTKTLLATIVTNNVASCDSCYSANWTAQADTSRPDGSVVLLAEVLDSYNALTKSAKVTIQVNDFAPPFARLISPGLNAQFDELQDILLEAQAGGIEAGATVTKVTFMSNGSVIGEVTSAPYILNWTNAPVGQQNLTVMATDSNGLTATSQQIPIKVNKLFAPSVEPLLAVEGLYHHQVTNTLGNYEVSWTPVARASFYRLYENNADQPIQSAAPTFRQINGKGNGRFSYFVEACNAKGCGPKSNIINVSVVKDVPAVPSTLTVVSQGTQSGDFSISWPTSGSAPQVTRYQLEQKRGTLDSPGLFMPVSLGDPRATIRQFQAQAAGRYTFQLRACNDAGCSDAGVQKTIEVLPPLLTRGELSCSGLCIRVQGLAIHGQAKVQLKAAHDIAIVQNFTATGITRIGNDELTVPITENSPIKNALFNRGVLVTITNPNGVARTISVFGDQSTASLTLLNGSPTLGEDGTVYVSMGDGLFALDPDTGAVLSGWPFETGGEIKGTPVIDGVSGNVYVGSMDHSIYSLAGVNRDPENPAGGSLTWSVETDGPIVSAPIIDESRALYVGSLDEKLYSLFAQDGEIKWLFPVGAGIAATPELAGDGTLFVTTVDGQTLTLDRGKLGPDILVFDSVDDSLLAADLDATGFVPQADHLIQYLRVSRLYRGLLQPQINYSKKIVTFWTFGLVNRLNLEEVADAFLNSATGSLNFPASLTNTAFLEALYGRMYAVEVAGGTPHPNISVRGELTTFDQLLALLESGVGRGDIAVMFSDSIGYRATVDQMYIDAFAYLYDNVFIFDESPCDTSTCDSDNDGLPDWFEILFFGSIEIETAAGDADSDGVTNLEAFLGRIDPCAALCVSVAEPPEPNVEAGPSAFDIAQADQVGGINGRFRPNESGSATYEVDIVAPPGTAGVAPNMRLNYAHNAINGLLGKGWSIGGLSNITRCRQSLAQDGLSKPITWTDEDRVCLDGQRLIVVSGNYFADGSEYRTEVESFVYVTYHADTNGGHFSAQKKDGSTTEYGKTADAKRSAVTGDVMNWAISNLQDSVGNAIKFNYFNDADGQRIDQIRYAFGSNTDNEGAKISFDYESRQDPQVLYVAGEAFPNTQRMSAVRVFNLGQEIRSYALKYAETTATSRLSEIASIEECAFDVCRPATTFTWQDPIEGNEFSSFPSQFSTKDDRQLLAFKPLDINGDGQTDIVWLEVDIDGSDTDHQFRYMLAEGERLVPADFSNGLGEITFNEDVDGEKVIISVIDYNADGHQDVMLYNSRGLPGNEWNVYLAVFQGGEWILSADPLSTPLSGQYVSFLDINGDGLADAVYASGNNLSFRLLTHDTSQPTSSNRYYHFGSEQDFTGGLSDLLDVIGDTVIQESGSDFVITSLTANTELSLVGTAADFNGDGRVDLVLKSKNTVCLAGGGCPTVYSYQQYIQQGTHGLEPYDGPLNVVLSTDRLQFNSGDFNQDSLSDVLYSYGSVTSGNQPWRLAINNGAQFNASTVYQSLDQGHGLQLSDFNRDGYTDVLRRINSGTNNENVVANLWDPNLTSFQTADLVVENIVSGNSVYLYFDVNGDGVSDQVQIGSNQISVKSTSTEEPLHTITNFSNGFGQWTKVHYEAISSSDNYQSLFDIVGGGAAFYEALNGDFDLPAGEMTLGKMHPTLDVMAPLYVVTSVESTAPAADATVPLLVDNDAVSRLSYFYEEAKTQASGRGFLGYHRISTLDEQKDVLTTTTYRQDFPFIGNPLNTTVRKPDRSVMKSTSNRLEIKGWAGSNSPSASAEFAPYHVFKPSAEAQNFDLQTANLLSTVITSSDVDEFGNMLAVTSTTIGAGETFSKKTDNTYGSDDFSQRWGRLSSSIVVHSRSDAPDIVRRSDFTYYDSGSVRGLLETETLEPGSVDELVTTHFYDEFGNEIKTEVEGYQDLDTSKPKQTRSLRKEYDSRGRFIERKFNALDLLEMEVLVRDVRSQPTRVIDINGVVIEMVHGAFGRQYFEQSATGAFKQTLTYEWTGAGINGVICPQGTQFYALETAGGGSQSYVCFDVLSREVKKGTLGFDGYEQYITLVEYDSSGRKKRVSAPHSEFSESPQWIESVYDIWDRPTRTDYADGTFMSMDYQGFAVNQVNRLGQASVQTSNAIGELVEVVDALQGQVTHQYDAKGNPTTSTTTGPITATGVPPSISVSMHYDLRDRKVSMDDPDKGSWLYFYNAFDELVEQHTSADEKTVMVYDLLGRMVSRVDSKDLAGDMQQSTSTWTYDTAKRVDRNGTEVGVALLELAVTSHQNSHGAELSTVTRTAVYDQFSRLKEMAVTFDNSNEQFVERFTFDEYSRNFQYFDASGEQRGTQWRYNQAGFMSSVAEASVVNGSAKLYYQVLETDARGHVTEELLGNGITTTREFDAFTSFLEKINSTVASGAEVLQDLDMQYDALGNLKSRTNFRPNLVDDFTIENFCYDDLNRMTGTAFNAGCAANSDFVYDSYGNFVSKLGLGDYGYDAARPHAVAFADGVDYQYDAKGNLISDSSGRSLNYTVFDKPYFMAKGLATTKFWYGADRSRYKRVDNTAENGLTTTLYVGSVEIIDTPGKRQFKRYIDGKVIVVEEENSDGVLFTDSIQYLLKDHQGSIDVVVGTSISLAAEAEYLSYDAWGKRRSSMNLDQPLSALAALTLSQDFTTRGYTGHEMIDTIGLIHMNGRVYDPHLGRFVSADPTIQAPGNTQSFNRYSYVWNNPLSYTDPSGYIVAEVIAFVVSAVISVDAIVLAVSAFSLSFIQTLYYGGSVGDAFEAGLTSAAFSAIGSVLTAGVGIAGIESPIVSALAYTSAGGIVSVLRGGKFGDAFVSAGISMVTSVALRQVLGPAGGVSSALIRKAIVGGTVSKLTGGKFANGAVSASYTYTIQRSHVVWSADTPTLYRVEVTDEGLKGKAVSMNETGIEKLFVNGQSNDAQLAIKNGFDQLGDPVVGSVYHVLYNPTHGALFDTLESALGINVGASNIARSLSGILARNGSSLSLVAAHSQGAIILSRALEGLGSELASRPDFNFYGPAANEQWTRDAVSAAGGKYGQWKANDFDFVGKVLGGGAKNPAEWIGAVLAAPLLVTPWSPHSTYHP